MSSDKKKIEFMVLSGGYSTDLRGKQSVRTTFKLSPRCIDALSLLATQLGIKQKSLFDHLIDDTQALISIARDFAEEEIVRSGRVPKTYVISRKTLEVLEQISRKFQAPRDVLVEFSIERIMPLINEEKKKHQKRKKLLAGMTELQEMSRQILEEADSLLDRDDPVFDRMYQMYRSVQLGCDEIETIIEKGTKLEEFK